MKCDNCKKEIKTGSTYVMRDGAPVCGWCHMHSKNTIERIERCSGCDVELKNRCPKIIVKKETYCLNCGSNKLIEANNNET